MTHRRPHQCSHAALSTPFSPPNDAAPAPPPLGEAGQPLPLTDREREIALLIGAGLSNREVAARLTISVRTVERHIYNAMAKTGTAGREDLAALLPRRRPVGESFPTGGRARY
jgi:DNA-binding CsgD family transcriptional regulator